MYSIGKRFFDIVVAAGALIVLAPVLLVTALVVLVSLGRPVLFLQPRVGRHGRPFTIVKFRTMRAGAGPDGARLTRVGAFLRATSLDELPELFLILRGTMSLIGPRPLLPQYVERYSTRQARRHDVRPGLTGLAQVNGRNALDWDHRLELDVQYVERCSARLDAAILARSFVTVLRRDGVTAAEHATMPEFQGGP